MEKKTISTGAKEIEKSKKYLICINMNSWESFELSGNCVLPGYGRDYSIWMVKSDFYCRMCDQLLEFDKILTIC